MKKRICGCIIVLIFTVNVLTAQTIPLGATGGARYITPGPYSSITSLPIAPPATIGDYYLENAWLQGSIILTDSTQFQSLYFRYNMKENYFEIKTEREVKVLPGARVVSFEWLNNNNVRDGVYINVAGFDYNGSKLKTFLKIINGGNYSVATGEEYKLIPANYNAALNVGERDDRIVKEEVHYLLHDNKILKVDSNKKKFTNDLSEFSGHDMSAFIKDSKIAPKELGDLVQVTEKLNTM
jgi:hypothetical protein